MSDHASSCLKMSSISSSDSLPLGCEHKEYYWIKRYRALKRRVKGDEGEEENDPPTLGRRDPTGARLRKLPCTRFYFEERQDDVLPYVRNLLGYPSETVSTSAPSRSKIAMLRTQQSLLVSPVQSRWFVVDVTRPMRMLIGATSESSERLQPQNLSCMRIAAIDLKGRGDRVKLLVTPSLGYGPNGGVIDGSPERYRLKGDFAIFINDKSISEAEMSQPGGGQPGITSTATEDTQFTAEDNIFGVAIWAGNLSDVKLVEQ